MEVVLGYNGYVIPEHWAPLRIQIDGPFDASSRIEIIRHEAETQHDIVESYFLQGVNRLECPVFAAESLKNITVRLLERDELVAEQIVNLKTRVFPGHLTLTANLPAIETQAIGRSLLPVEPMLAIPLDIYDLPNLGLDYDGVSCLVLNEPEPILTPAQLKSLRFWLTGGGKLIVCGAGLDFKKLMAAAFGVKQIDPGQAPLTTPVGLGSISIIQNHLNEMRPEDKVGFWRQLLALEPYRKTVRLTTNNCFFTGPWRQNAAPASYPFLIMAIILVVWGGVALVIMQRNSQNFLVDFLIFSLLCSILAIPAARLLMAGWHRGALIFSRAVLLPDSGGMLLATDIHTEPINPIRFSEDGASPWGSILRLGEDELGDIDLPAPKDPTNWDHRTVFPWYTVYAGGDAGLELMGVFPDVLPDFSGSQSTIATPLQLPVTTRTVLWDGKQWRVLQSIKSGRKQWVNLTQAPAWLEDDEGWLRKLQSLTPEVAWLYGRSSLPPRLKLQIQGYTVPELSWAMPCLKPL